MPLVFVSELVVCAAGDLAMDGRGCFPRCCRAARIPQSTVAGLVPDAVCRSGGMVGWVRCKPVLSLCVCGDWPPVMNDDPRAKASRKGA